MLLDEIDKLCDNRGRGGVKGDVQNALLEILDYS
jgi:ATP-dependent Lon protease